MEVDEILSKANEAVEKANIPDKLKNKAFEKAIELYSRDLPNSSSTTNQQFARDANLNSGQTGGNSILNEIAQKLKIEPAILEEMYYVEDDDLKIIISSGKLESSNAGATKQIALITVGGRQLGQMENWTSVNVIRDKCDYFGKYDSPNFANTISGMDDVFSQKGKGQKKELRLKRPGQEEFKKLVLRLLEGQ